LPDGVHLILIKKEEVTDRFDSSYQEVTHLMRMTMMVGRSMYDVLDIKPMNYQDLETGASMSRVGRIRTYTSSAGRSEHLGNLG
jgi:hypothetical protein